MKRTLECLLSGAVVYVAMAAQAAGGCSGGPETYLYVGDRGGEGGRGGEPFAGAGATGGGFGGAAGDVTSGEGGGGAGGLFDPVSAAEAKSGARLRALRYRGADGAEDASHVWLDAERNERCAFRPAADGKLRCLPDATPLGPLQDFADSGCTTPVALVDACEGAPSYVSLAPAGPASCAAGRRLYRLAEAVVEYYSGEPGACFGPNPVAGSKAAHHVAEVPPEAFVEVTLVEAPLKGPSPLRARAPSPCARRRYNRAGGWGFSGEREAGSRRGSAAGAARAAAGS